VLEGASSWDETIRSAAEGDQDAYHSLLEAPAELDRRLEECFESRDGTGRLRELVVELIWQRKHPRAPELLAHALADPSDEVRKQALDGLVSIGGAECRAIVARAAEACDPRDEWRGWLVEAGEQIDELGL